MTKNILSEQNTSRIFQSKNIKNILRQKNSTVPEISGNGGVIFLQLYFISFLRDPERTMINAADMTTAGIKTIIPVVSPVLAGSVEPEICGMLTSLLPDGSTDGSVEGSSDGSADDSTDDSVEGSSDVSASLYITSNVVSFVMGGVVK